MPTLYVENVRDDIYEALRARAQARRKSISAEVLELLEQNVPTAAELARRKEMLNRARQIRSRRSSSPGPFPTTEEMQGEDRHR
jgi:plasmid stability protein